MNVNVIFYGLETNGFRVPQHWDFWSWDTIRRAILNFRRVGKPVQRVLKTWLGCAKGGRNLLEYPNFALVFQVFLGS